MQMAALRKESPRYAFWQINGNDVLVERRPYGGSVCTLGVHEALSYHPGYAGSNLEAIAALEYSPRQSCCGHWGGGRSMVLHNLARLSHPLAAFLVARSIPALIHEQQPNGMRCDGNPPEDRDGSEKRSVAGNTPEEIASFRILTALKRFGFLNMLLPSQEAST